MPEVNEQLGFLTAYLASAFAVASAFYGAVRWFGNDLNDLEDDTYEPVDKLFRGHPVVIEARFPESPPSITR